MSHDKRLSKLDNTLGHLTFESFQEAWITTLSTLYRRGEVVSGIKDEFSVGSTFGKNIRDTKELTAFMFSILSPRRRLLYSKQRPINLSYAIANTLWVLSGSNDVEMISFYNPRGKNFSDNGSSLFAAPGARIFHSAAGNQLERVVERLSSDPTSRRAVIQLFLPDDLIANSRDCSCAVSLQFLLRNNALSCMAYMRSQSALMVMPYDVFLFSMIQELLALYIGVGLGTYSHFCGSLHYYNDEEELVNAVLDEDTVQVPEMPSMTSASSDILLKLKIAENDIRLQLKENPSKKINVNNYGLDIYWSELLSAMIIGFQHRHGISLQELDSGLTTKVYTDILTTI